MIIQAHVFYAIAGPGTDEGFPGACEEARHVGVVMRRWLASLSCLAGLAIFLARGAEAFQAKRILFGCAIGFATICAIMIKTFFNEAAVIPLPALGLYIFTSCLSLYASLRAR